MAKIALISDIHANYEALKNVVTKLDTFNPDVWVCLGDLVGYGPSPNEVVNLVREKEMKCVLGNHDAGVTGKLTLRHFRNPNRKLIEKSIKLLTESNMKWLKNLPFILKEEDFIAVHASPQNPGRWEYIESAFTARNILDEIDETLCFVGHTHKPSITSNKLGINSYRDGYKFMINPGSVGQSRDDDYRASACFIDTDLFIYESLRIDFNTEPVLLKLMKLGFSRLESQQMLRLNR